ncbi:TonB-dependent receptor [Flavobacteriaceae bacterium MHTCC 0001]
MKKQTITLFLLMLAYIGYCQTGTITGVTVDASGSLPGVNILVRDTGKGAISKLDGNFTITNVPTGKQTLVLSFIGYKTLEKEITVSAGENNLGTISLSESDEQLEQVVIKSTIRQSQMKALSIQKSAPNIMNVIAATAIGKLPDHNAAEAVQRISGVAIERDQGEGRFVLVRGTPIQWSSTLVNGDRMPSTRSGDRGVPLDIFPSELIQFVQVSKAITPDMEGDVIGGSVNFITRTSPSKETFLGSVAAGYNGQSQSRILNGSLIYGNRSKDQKFGYIATAATWNRDWGSDNYELVYNTGSSDPVHSIQQLQLRDYLGNRTTYGFNGAMDYSFNSTNKIYLKGMWTDFKDEELRYRTRFRFGRAEEDITEGRIEHAFTNTIYHSRFRGAELGGANGLSDKIKLDWKLSSYQANFWYDSPVNRNVGLFDSAGPENSEDRGYYFSTWVQNDVIFDDLVDVNGRNYKFFSFDSPNGVGESDIENFQPRINANTPIDASQALLSNAQASGRWIKERDITAKLDFTIDASDNAKIKIGGKLRGKDRTANRAVTIWSPDGDVSMTDVENEAFPERGGFLTEINRPYDEFLVNYPTIQANDDLINLPGVQRTYQSPTSPERAADTYNATEDIFAAYGMITWNLAENWTMIGGARFENTSIDYNSYQVDEDDNVSPLNAKRSFGAFLPMLHLKYSPNTKTNYRFALTRTFIRPDFVDLSPSRSIDFGELTASIGNPDLDPTFAWNLDLLVEHYFSNVGVLSAGIFYKDVTDVIFESNTQRTIEGDVFNVSTPLNASDAWLLGFEFGLQKRLDFLPGFLSGFGVEANYTFTDSEVQVPGRDVKQPLFGQSKNIYNASLFYEKYGLSARIAANFKGSYLDELQGSGPEQDRYYDDNLNLDFSASYNISKKIRVFMEVNNLLNEPLRYYHGDKNRPEQVEWYSLRGQAGVTVSF